jgi:hypothetical protein
MNSNAIENLETSLRVANAAALGALAVSEFSILEEELPRLRGWAGTGTGPGLEVLEAGDLAAAVRTFRESGTLNGIGHARLVCYGCTSEIDSSTLIEEPRRMAPLLEYIDRYRYFPRPFRRCYRALLDAYFSYDPEESGSEDGKEGWRQVWVFLERRKNLLETPGADPEWVTALLENRNVLTRDPTSRYGMAALEGNYTAFDSMRARLGIADESWLMRRLVLSELEAAVQLNDEHFKSVVVRLLVLFAKHPLLLDYGLGKVIDRYALSARTEAHARLRDFAVRNWGDPRRPSNAPHWSGVQPASSEMVAGWMATSNPSPP